MIIQDDYDKVNNQFYINIFPTATKLTSIIEINHPDYKVDFNISNSFASLLGYEKQGF